MSHLIHMVTGYTPPMEKIEPALDESIVIVRYHDIVRINKLRYPRMLVPVYIMMIHTNHKYRNIGDMDKGNPSISVPDITLLAPPSR